MRVGDSRRKGTLPVHTWIHASESDGNAPFPFIRLVPTCTISPRPRLLTACVCLQYIPCNDPAERSYLFFTTRRFIFFYSVHALLSNQSELHPIAWQLLAGYGSYTKGEQCPVQQYHLCRSASECHWLECDSKTELHLFCRLRRNMASNYSAPNSIAIFCSMKYGFQSPE